MKGLVKAGKTDHTVDVFILDSSSTTGAGLTGLAYNTASLVCHYRKGATGSATAITLATQTVGGAHSDGGFVEISAANMPGLYRLDLPDAVIDTAGVSKVMLKGATNMAPVILELQCVAFNPDDAVRLGLTALPNAAADAAGGLPISDAGGLDLDAQRSDVAAILVDTGTTLDGRIPAALVSGRMDCSVGAYQSGLTPLQPTTAGRTLDVSAGGEAGMDWANIGSPTTSQTLSGTTISTSQAVASVSGSVGSVTGAVGSVTGAVGSVTGAVGSVTGNVGGNVTGSVGSVATGGIASTSFAAGAITAAVIATDAIDADAIAASAVTKIQSGLSTLTAAQVNTEVDTALADVRLDELLAADSDIDGAAPPTVGSVVHEMLSKTAGSFTFDQTTDSLEAIRDNQSAGGGATAQQVWEYASRTLTAGASITAVNPINADTYDLELWKGDDYYTTDTGRTLSWTVSGMPSLTGATIAFRILDGTGTAVLTKAGSVVSATVAAVELSNTNTNLTPGAYRYDLKATLASTSHVITLVAGSCVVRS